MKKLGLIGARGMVGSVLLDRMMTEGDFQFFETSFFSVSNSGGKAPEVANGNIVLLDAHNIAKLAEMDIILSCQGGDYCQTVFDKLKNTGWDGYWIDSSSYLRMRTNSLIVLDPINRKGIEEYISQGGKILVGGNCTVSLMLLALHGLFKDDLVKWVSSMTYQAASGAGAAAMVELIGQMKLLSDGELSGISPLLLEKNISQIAKGKNFLTKELETALACNLIPWIDSAMDNGQTREEWKGEVEANKILGYNKVIPVDGICVRVGSLRCHSQAITVKLKKNLSILEIENILSSANAWVKVVKNSKEQTLEHLTPISVSGTLNIPVGRIRKMTLGDKYITLFTVGDQLLWGAAEPLRRVLRMII